MSNSEFQFNFKFKLHKSNIPIGLKDDDYPRLSVAYGVPLDEVMAEVEADESFNAKEAEMLLKGHPQAASALRNRRIAFMGDSITSDRRSYYNIIHTALKDANVRFYDDSVSAYKLLDIITNFVPGMRDFHAEVAHLMIGSNDMKQTTDAERFLLVEPEEFRRQLRYLLNTLESHGTKVIVSTIPPFDSKKVKEKFWGVNTGYSEAIRDAYNAVIREEVAHAGGVLNDMEGVYARYGTDELTRDDGLHLNQLGQRLMANVVLDKVLSAFDELKKG